MICTCLNWATPQEIPVKTQNVLRMRKTKRYTRYCAETTVTYVHFCAIYASTVLSDSCRL